MSGFSYPQAIFKSSIYNPAYYLSLDPSGFLSYQYAQTLSKNDYRLTYISGITLGVATAGVALVLGNDLSLSGLGAVSCSSLTISGLVVNVSALTGVTPGAALANKALVLDSSTNIRDINQITCGNIVANKYAASTPSTLSLTAITSDYPLYINHTSTTNGNQSGIAFIVAGDATSTSTASIFARRSGNASKGHLVFNTKPTTGALDTLVERMIVTDAGRVGIGTSTPGFQLDVTGDFRCTGLTSSAYSSFSGGVNVSSGDLVIQTGQNIIMDDAVQIILSRDMTTTNINSKIYSEDTGSLIFESSRGGGYMRFKTNRLGGSTTDPCVTLTDGSNTSSILCLFRNNTMTFRSTNQPANDAVIDARKNQIYANKFLGQGFLTLWDDVR